MVGFNYLIYKARLQADTYCIVILRGFLAGDNKDYRTVLLFRHAASA